MIRMTQITKRESRIVEEPEGRYKDNGNIAEKLSVVHKEPSLITIL